MRGSAERGDPGKDAAIAPTFADAGRPRSGVPSTPLPAGAAPLTGHGWFQHRGGQEAAAQCQRVHRELLRVDMWLKLPVSVHPLAPQRGLIPARSIATSQQPQGQEPAAAPRVSRACCRSDVSPPGAARHWAPLPGTYSISSSLFPCVPMGNSMPRSSLALARCTSTRYGHLARPRDELDHLPDA